MFYGIIYNIFKKKLTVISLIICCTEYGKYLQENYFVNS